MHFDPRFSVSRIAESSTCGFRSVPSYSRRSSRRASKLLKVNGWYTLGSLGAPSLRSRSGGSNAREFKVDLKTSPPTPF